MSLSKQTGRPQKADESEDLPNSLTHRNLRENRSLMKDELKIKN